MLEQVMSLLATLIGAPALQDHPDLPLYDLHLLDSFKTIELMIALSDRFGIELSPAEFEREEWATPRAIASVVERKLTNAAFQQ